MTINFYLEGSKKVKGQRAIRCYIREGREGIFLNTGERISPEIWDKKLQRANLRKIKDKITKGTYKNLNDYLNGYENKVRQIALIARTKEPNTEFPKIAEQVKIFFNKTSTNLFDIYNDFINIKISKGLSNSAINKHERTRDLLEDFEQKNGLKLTFSSITNQLIDKFFAFLISDKNLLDNTAYKNIAFLRTFIRWSFENGYLEKLPKIETHYQDTDIVVLTEKELMNLYNLELESDRLARTRDIFLFQCFTGVRYSDIERLDRADISRSVWTVRIKKTKEKIEIPLNSYALSILAKYKDHPKPLPVITNQKINVYLKELCKKAKITDVVKTISYRKGKEIVEQNLKHDLITTHTARRTFVSVSLQKGMKPEVIMAITGHKTYTMMQKYLKIADETKREEMDKIWGSSLRKVN